jgi:hypothetical protein
MKSHYKGLCKYGVPHPTINSKAWEFSKECIQREFFPVMCNSTIVDQETVISQLDKKTSNGTFLKYLFGNKGKFFEHPLSRDYLQDYWDLLLHREKMIHCLRQMSDKYEVRPTDKLKENKIRVFTADETASIVANNRFSLHMNQKFYMNHTKFSSVVGRSKFYAGFQIFFEMIRRFKLFFSTDVSGWDTVQFFLLQVEQMMFRWSCLRREDQTQDNWARFSNYYLSTIMSFLHAIDGNIYFKQFGVCSGFGNTLIDNTINLFRVWTYVFADLYFASHDDQLVFDTLTAVYNSSPIDSLQKAIVSRKLQDFEKDTLSYDMMNTKIGMLLTGDDNTHGVCDSITSWFNVDSVTKSFLKLGITMNYEHILPKSIEEVTFLSQHWVKIPQIKIYLPSPDFGKVIGSLIHGCKSPDPRWSLMRAFALRIECWANLQAREAVEDYIKFMYSTHREFLTGEFIIPGTETDNGGLGQKIKMSTIESCHLTASQLDRLYTGEESWDALNDVTQLLKTVDYSADFFSSFYGNF